MISASSGGPAARGGLADASGDTAQLPYGDDEGDVWLIADPTRGFTIGAGVSRPAVAGARFGSSTVDGVEVLVERVPISYARRYVEDRLQGLLTSAREQLGDAGTRREEDANLGATPFSGDTHRAREVVARAQRSLRPRGDTEMGLREQLLRIGGDGMGDLIAGAFSDAGSLKVSLVKLMNRIDAMGRASRDSSAARLGAGESDARVLAMLRTPLNLRHRDFKATVGLMHESGWEDWPLTGPRTTLFVLSFIAEHCGTPEQRHARFVLDGRLQAHDAGVQDHLIAMKVLYFGAVYDQLEFPPVGVGRIGEPARAVYRRQTRGAIPAAMRRQQEGPAQPPAQPWWRRGCDTN